MFIRGPKVGPAATLNHAPSPIDIKTLLLIPIGRATSAVKCLWRTKISLVRQNKWLKKDFSRDSFIFNRYSDRLKFLRFAFHSTKRIPRLYLVTIDQQLKTFASGFL